MAEPAVVSIEITYARKVNWSQMRAGLPLVLHLEMRLSECISERTVEIALSVDGFTLKSNRETVTLHPSTQKVPKNIRLDWDFDEAANLSQTRHKTLRFKIRDSQAGRWAEIRLPLELLALTEWDSVVDDWADTFYRSPVIEVCKANLEYRPPHRFVSIEQKKTKWSWSGQPPLEAAVVSLIFPMHTEFTYELKAKYRLAIETINEEEADRTLRAAYMALLQQFPGAFHVGEPKRFHYRFQPIRTPEQILSGSRLYNWLQRRGATCIDYALLFCGWLEHNELSPLLIILSNDGVNLHALVGIWLNPAHKDVGAILDHKTFFSHRDDIAVVDITFWPLGRRYPDAKKRADDLLEQARKNPAWFCYALSVLDARGLDPENDQIEPLPLPKKKMRAWPQIAILICIIALILIPFWPPVLVCRAEITHLDNMSIIQNRAEIFSGGETVEFKLSGNIKPAGCDDHEVFVLMKKRGDSNTQVIGPAQRQDESWQLPMKLGIDGGGDSALFELFLLVVEQHQATNEKLSLLRDEARENNPTLSIAMRKASLTIEEVSNVGPYARIRGKAVNLPDRMTVEVETTLTTRNDWTWRSDAVVEKGAWEVPDFPLRSANQEAGYVKVRAVLPRQAGIFQLGAEILSEHKQSIFLPNPKLRITKFEVPVDTSERSGAGPKLRSEIMVSGEVENALIDDLIWAFVLVIGPLSGNEDVWPKTSSSIVDHKNKTRNKETGVIGWFQVIPTIAVGFDIRVLTVKADVWKDPPPANFKIINKTKSELKEWRNSEVAKK